MLIALCLDLFLLRTLGIQLPTTANQCDILKSVYLISDDSYDKLLALNDDELTILFTVFNSITFKQQPDAVIHYISKLPIFTSMYNKLVDLSSFSRVWIWNDAVCKAGIKEWITCIPKSEVFLHPNAPWSVPSRVFACEVYFNV